MSDDLDQVRLARELPRDPDRAVAELRRSASQHAMAERAFFALARDGEVVIGPSVHLARELSRCWGNMRQGVRELRSDPSAGVTLAEAWCWDLEGNTRTSNEFVVRHDGRDVRDVVASHGARRLRDAILDRLPRWFTEVGIETAYESLLEGGGIPLGTRYAALVSDAEQLGVSLASLERAAGRPAAAWDGRDVALLAVRVRSVQRGEATSASVFRTPIGETEPEGRVTAAEILGGRADVPGRDGVPGASAGLWKRRYSRAGRTAELTGKLRAAGLTATAAGWSADDELKVVEIAAAGWDTDGR